MQYNLIAFTCGISRAYEIAKCGNHTVRLIPVENKDGEKLDDTDLALLKSFYEIADCEEPSMVIEVCKPDARTILNVFTDKRTETKEQVDARIKEFITKEAVAFNDNLSSTYQAFLTTATDRLNLRIKDLLKIFEVAKTIAQMEGCAS